MTDDVTTLEILSPSDGASLSSPLAVVRGRYQRGGAASALLSVNDVEHVVELEEPAGELQQNVTLIEGQNCIRLTVGDVQSEVRVELPESQNITFKKPGPRTRSFRQRALRVRGWYQDVTCPAGVIAVNGVMQQIAIEGDHGPFSEKVVLYPGANHIAIQIGEFYATKHLIGEGQIQPERLLATLSWDSTKTADLFVAEPRGRVMTSIPHKSSHEPSGWIAASRRVGFGPQTYVASSGGQPPRPGIYRFYIRLQSRKLLRRTEWTMRLVADEGQRSQRTRTYLGIFDKLGNRWRGGNSREPPPLTGRSGLWCEICAVEITNDGEVLFDPDITEG